MTLSAVHSSPVSAHRHAAGAPVPLPLHSLVRALSTRDLTDPEGGPHALQLVVESAAAAVAARWPADVRVLRSRPVVSLEDNYDRLGYPPDAVARDARYSRYVSDTTMLRSHTSAGVPPALRQLAREHDQSGDVLLVLPGMAHRRDSIDRLHTGTPHQLDLWLLRRGGRRLDHDDLYDLVATVTGAMLPGRHWRWAATRHPYTTGGRQVDVIEAGYPVEIAECGLAADHVLRGAGLDPSHWAGLAMGLGLDRILMLRKGIPDIRLLRSDDERVAGQMLDLAPYRPVSELPPAHRDVSVAVSEDLDDEVLGDRVREALGPDAELVEAVTVLAVTPSSELPDAARDRLGMSDGQLNLLLRVTMRPVDRTLTGEEVNALRDRIVVALHEGTRDGTDGAPPGA